MDAIVYTSNSGYTAQYAKMLGGKTGLPVYELAEAGKKLPKGSDIIYMGWLLAGFIKEYKKASTAYNIKAAVGVCMGGTGSQIPDVRKNNKLPETMPVFTLQGGFDMKKLRGIYRFMMKFIIKVIGKDLESRKSLTTDEEAILDMVKNGGNYVSEKNITALMKWWETVK